MSSQADSFFDVWTTLTFFITFTGTVFVTFIAPMNIFPGAVAFPKYVEECVVTCTIKEVPINIFWGGLINGAFYGALGTLGFIGIRKVLRLLKKYS